MSQQSNGASDDSPPATSEAGATAPNGPESTERDLWQPLKGIDASHTDFPTRALFGRLPIVVFKVGDTLRATERFCPHQFAKLDDAIIQGSDKIRCRAHNCVFRLSDGKAVNCPGYRLKVFEVRLDCEGWMGRAAN